MDHLERDSVPAPMHLIQEITELVDRPGVAPSVRCLALAHGASCIHRFDAVGLLYGLAADRGASPTAMLETALQVVPYGGVPSAIEGLDLLRQTVEGLPKSTETSNIDKTAEGKKTFQNIYHDQAQRVLDQLDELMDGLSDLVIEDAYGRILSRPGLDLGNRELLAVAALSLMGLGAPLQSHMIGALRNGSSPDDVTDILESCRVLANENSISVIDSALDRLSRKIIRP